MTSFHIAPYSTSVRPAYSVGDEVFCTRLGCRCTISGVHVCRLNSGAFCVFYCFDDSSADTYVWYPEVSLMRCDPYVRDCLGYCVFVGNTVRDTCSHYGFGDQVVVKVDASSGRAFLKRSPGSRYGYWCRGRDLAKIA